MSKLGNLAASSLLVFFAESKLKEELHAFEVFMRCSRSPVALVYGFGGRIGFLVEIGFPTFHL